MIFIDNKYTRWYFTIVNNAKLRKEVIGYVENHHIIPRSLGGKNNSNNLVSLSAREHFICHRLLTKMTTNNNRKKMLFAQNMMLTKTPKQQRHSTTSRTYKHIKEEFSKVNPFKDEQFKEESIKRHTGKKRSEETKQKQRDAWTPERKEHISKMFTGKKQKAASPFKGKKRPELTGEKNGFYGKQHTEETIEHLKAIRKGLNPSWINKKKTCEYCGKTLDIGNYSQHHGEKCKFKV